MPNLKYDYHIFKACLCFCMLFILNDSSANAEPELQPKADIAPPRAEIVWPEVTDGTYQIFYSALMDDRSWSPKIQISSSNTLNLAPAISSDSNGITRVVWSSVDGADSRLIYSFFDGAQWSEPEKIETGLSSNTGPSIVIDEDNVLWVVWVGFDGVDDDIYFIRRNENGWSRPSKVNRDNDVPDISPAIVIASDNPPSVYWTGFNGETYSRYLSKWTAEGWSEKKAIDPRNFKALVPDETQFIPGLPEFIKEPQKAVVYMRMKNDLQSTTLRAVKSD